jgi:kynurenine formamidase
MSDCETSAFTWQRIQDMWIRQFSILALIMLASCDSATPDRSADFSPTEVIDLGALVTEDIAQQVAGRAFLAVGGIDRLNQFDLVTWTVDIGGGSVSGSNAFYTLANHGGPHVDAPNHVGLEGGIDSFSIGAFSGPLEVFDVSEYPKGFSVPRTVFEGQGIEPGDVVMIYTDYQPPQDDKSFPETVTLTRGAAEYLAKIPVRAFATDAYSVANLHQQAQIESDDLTAQVVPIHHSFLSRGIPVYEQLFNVETLIGKDRMFFIGVPVNIRDGDGMIVRPLVFVY